MCWAGGCSRSFPILSVAVAQTRTSSRESLIKRCPSRRQKNGWIISALAVDATKDFSELRKVREVQRRRTLLAIAASILVAVGIAGRVLIRRNNEPLVAPTAVVDLRNSSVSRSPELNPEEKPLELRRGFAQLNVYLPLGTPEGVYEVRIVTISGDLLLKAGGTAEVKDGVTALEVKVNVFVASPGQYNLQIRKPPSEWSSYPLVLR